MISRPQSHVKTRTVQVAVLLTLGLVASLAIAQQSNKSSRPGHSPFDLQHPATVHLKVLHDGRNVAAPTMIKVTFDGHSLRLPVRDGKFEAPTELLAAPKVILETNVADSHIRLVNVTGWDFAYEDWTLRLAEHTDVNYYEWPGPKGADIPSPCMLEFESVHTDPGRGLFEQNCRTKKD